MSEALLTLVVLGVTIALFVWNRLPVEVVAIGSAIALWAVGVLDPQQVLRGFGDATVVLIASLFVVSEGLDSTGVTAWIGQRLLGVAGSGPRRLLIFTMLLAAGLTAVISINGAVAALLPMAVLVAVRQRLRPSRLLMPLAFAASAGSMLLLTGSPVNVIFADTAGDLGLGRFGFAEFALAGIPLLAGTLLIIVGFGWRLVPDRRGEAFADLSQHATTLARHYGLESLSHLRLVESSALVGRPREELDLAAYPGLNVIMVYDAAHDRPSTDGALAVGDRLTVTGAVPIVERYAADQRLRIDDVRTREQTAAALVTKTSGVGEVIIPPRSRLIGEVVRPGRLVRDGSLVVLAVQRQGRDRGREKTVLQVGDTLLLEGSWSALDAGARDDDVLVIDSPELVRRQAVPLAARSGRALAILAVMVVLLATGVVPAAIAALLSAGAMIIFRVLTVQQAYRRIPWSTVLLVAGMIPMSTAISVSGAGQLVGGAIVRGVGGAGPYAVLTALFVVTVVFGQLISNAATALVMIPIAVSAAGQLGMDVRMVLMSLCVASAAAFLTPIATPANMMIMAPAGYRFGDYWRLGLVMVALFGLVSIGLVPQLF
ncbi:SLC13 family permease [Microlunatus ginsengisoli]|uniref:SLC13 family permease n=1 Tax=Microlunatus ginsengisoli TaxID=363863 RepID=A0ABP6ZT77_9ACTN